ncbi:hypothetical protein U5922_010650 [Aquicoccus sp. G2-2]|uniref:hypothetical protein n=1 Tax=Aquicoccus sp. G2-2 TaxID=3092120 RepID=UPI002ADFCCF2|nr:hypothetical protein [Aquicoccus sp. G2-2]MEA1113902.1 hypothetical protein [Aquicoccus sp. G2-2]
MRNLLLSVALIAAPVGVFAAGYTWLTPQHSPTETAAAMPTLGDMTPFAAIVSDVQNIAAQGDLAAAGTRITDLETVWDKAQPSLRPMNPPEWGYVDGAIDKALSALRASTPDAAQVKATLASLQIALADPSNGGKAGNGTVQMVAGIATTDTNGHPLPCEAMLKSFRATQATATLPDTVRAKVSTLEAKGTERCNADDDTRADDFFAQGIALMVN